MIDMNSSTTVCQEYLKPKYLIRLNYFLSKLAQKQVDFFLVLVPNPQEINICFNWTINAHKDSVYAL